MSIDRKRRRSLRGRDVDRLMGMGALLDRMTPGPAWHGDGECSRQIRFIQLWMFDCDNGRRPRFKSRRRRDAVNSEGCLAVVPWL